LTVFRGPGDEGKPADHVSIDHIVVFAAGRVLPLPSEYLEMVSVERPTFGFNLLPEFRVVTFGLRIGHQRSNRAFFPVEVRWPVEPIVFPRGTHEPLGIFQNLIAILIGARIFSLGLHVSAHDRKCREFVPADAAAEQFVLAGLGVEGPPAIPLHDGDREWPQVIAQFEDDECI
jgi:hypothetical protein